MPEKSYSQMQTEYIAYCNKYIKPYLPEYEKKRRENLPKSVLSVIIIVSLLITIILFFRDKILFAVIAFAIFVISVIIHMVLTKDDPDSTNLNIDFNFENKLKDKYMKPILSIFSNCYNWEKGISENYFKKQVFIEILIYLILFHGRYLMI